MGKFMRKCKGIGEVAVMEVSHSHSHVGVKTRARSLAIAQAKRRKSSSPENSISELNSPRTISSAATCSDQIPASRCSSEIVNESLRSVTDLEDTHEEFENSPYRDSMRELHSESNQLESRPEAAAAKMPSVAELEDFFAQAEKDDTKKFAEKYNFDFVNDTPLEGRFEWIPLKQ